MTMHSIPARGLLALALSLAAVPAAAQASSAVQVTVVTDEADAALALASAVAAGQTPDSAAWNRLFRSEGYVRLKEREAGMGRSMSDSAFRAFILSPELRARIPALRQALEGWRRLDPSAAAARAFAYLPRGATLRARIFPVVKPRTNSFVWDLNGRPAVFFYLDPDVPPAQAENTMAHELHHVGYAQSCPDGPEPADGPGRAVRYMGTFGEGWAVLAAAGGPDVHPHASSPAGPRAVWDRDVANWKRDFADLERFFVDVARGRSGTEEETTRRWFRFVATDTVPQGAFYTVGWMMASTVERELGRETLVGSICSPPAFLAAYNRAARRVNARRGEPMPLWSPELFAAIGAPDADRD